MKCRHLIGYSMMVALLFAMFVVNVRQSNKLNAENLKLRSRLNWITFSAQQLTKGEGDLYIYSMTNTDELLSIFANRPDVDNISIEMTDVGRTGIRSIASIPNVQSISFSGDFGVNDETLLILAQCKQLKFLDLTCTQVTDSGIESLRLDLPECKIQQN